MPDFARRFLTLTVCFAAGCSSVTAQSPAAPAQISPPQPSLRLDASGIKFNLVSLMSVLRDRDHEGWVLAAYPDPNTGRPLIGAGFGLDVVATDHPQSDLLNSHQFVEPSTAQLWHAAGLDTEQLSQILTDFSSNREQWGTKLYRKKTRKNTLSPQLTETEAIKLLRVSAQQAIHNAKAYCRNFDRLNGPQQMALSQLVFQMGVNLEEFVHFLSELNGDAIHRDLSMPDGGAFSEADHWKNVQYALIDSQWARLYTTRAVTVIAMFDPNYAKNPTAAQRKVMDILRPAPPPRRKKVAAHHAVKPSHR